MTDANGEIPIMVLLAATNDAVNPGFAAIVTFRAVEAEPAIWDSRFSPECPQSD